jgi:hypothetical protein
VSMFKRATKSQSRLRMALVGPSGSGKTYSALSIAGGLGSRIAVIDTEHGSASKYAGEFTFDTLQLGQFDPRNYIEAIQGAESEGYEVIIIDSLSHAWMGKGGALEMVDAAAKRSRSNNSFTAWRDVTPLHNALVEAMIQSRCHIIATMRSKVDYVLEPDPQSGKLTPKKVGMAPIQREGMDYEFDVVGDLDHDHNFIVSKTRCRALDGQVINKPGQQIARTLTGWLSDGAPLAPIPDPQAQSSQTHELPRGPSNDRMGLISSATADHLLSLRRDLEMSDQQWLSALARRGAADVTQLSTNDADTLLNTMAALLAKKQAESLEATGDNKFPFEAAAKPEDIAAHQAAQDPRRADLPSQAVASQASDLPQSAAGDETATALATATAAEDFQLPDVHRPEKPERPAKAKKSKAASNASNASEASSDKEAALTNV